MLGRLAGRGGRERGPALAPHVRDQRHQRPYRRGWPAAVGRRLPPADAAAGAGRAGRPRVHGQRGGRLRDDRPHAPDVPPRGRRALVQRAPGHPGSVAAGAGRRGGRQRVADGLPGVLLALHPLDRRAVFAEDGAGRQRPGHRRRGWRPGRHDLLHQPPGGGADADALDHGPRRRPGRRHREPRRGHRPPAARRRVPQPRRRRGHRHLARLGLGGPRDRRPVQHLHVPRRRDRRAHHHRQLARVRQVAGPALWQAARLPRPPAAGRGPRRRGRGRPRGLLRQPGARDDRRAAGRHQRGRALGLADGRQGRRRGHARRHHPPEQRLRLGAHGGGVRAIELAADDRRLADRRQRGHPVRHHVQGHEPLLG
mmetsp:Transcript_59861/g.182912  ORF Transcript_59861/g.182912 Transcript_59861/m.182912 type:complete len:368 (-) Transcript_59861:735-1838(-)